MRGSVISLLLAAFMLLPTLGAAQPAPIQLRMNFPKSRGPGGVLQGGNYTIVFSLRVPDAVAFVRDFGTAQALVLSDPDDCLDLSHFSFSPFETCAGGPDETFLRFFPEAFDQPARADFCASAVRDRLVDDAYDPSNVSNLNKPYLIAGGASGFGGNTDGILVLRPVGVFTGGTVTSTSDFEDCYGLSADDDIPGLVVMADIGPLRVFDENFNRVGARVRNFAGMLNSVTTELVDKIGRSSIVGVMRAPAGLLEPITLVDRSVTDPSVDFMTRRDSGPVESFAFATPPANQQELVGAILATYPEFEFIIRAVVVEGPAPEFIDDLDGNGRFDKRDVEMAGYNVISNQSSLRIRAVQNDVFEQKVDFNCPAAILAGDLDGNGITGYSCNTGSGRSIRRPPI